MTMITPAPLNDSLEFTSKRLPRAKLGFAFGFGRRSLAYGIGGAVAHVEPADKVENQTVDVPPIMKFTWTIEKFTRLTTKKLYSDIFIADDYKWRILIFPKGNNVVDRLSMYLVVPDASSLPNGWSRDAQFSLSVIDQINNKFSVRKETQHQFNAEESDWGFTSFIPLRDLCDPKRGYLVNDTIVIEAVIVVTKPRTGVPSVGSSPQARNEALSVPPRERSPPRTAPLPVSRDVDDKVAPIIERAPVPSVAPSPPMVTSSSPGTAAPPAPPRTAPLPVSRDVDDKVAPIIERAPVPSVAPPPPIVTSSSSGTAAPPASIPLPDDDDSDLALFEGIGITFPVSKPCLSTTETLKTAKRTEILKALSTVVCYLHDVKDSKDIDWNAKPPLAVFKALETLKTQGSGLLPKEKITMISKLSTELSLTVCRYKVRHDLLQGIAMDENDIEAHTKAFEDADATIRTMSTDYWEARQQRDAKRKEFTAAEDEISRLQAGLARAQERASELQSQLTEAEQRRLTSFRACADFKETVLESARIKRVRVARSLELKKAMYAKEKNDLDMAHHFLLDVISCLDTKINQ